MSDSVRNILIAVLVALALLSIYVLPSDQDDQALKDADVPEQREPARYRGARRRRNRLVAWWLGYTGNGKGRHALRLVTA